MAFLPPAAVRWHWPARIDTLRIRLFVAIAGAQALLVLVAFLVFSWSFDQGFVEYLNRADEARLKPVIERLADGHAREGSWDWVARDRNRWVALLRDVLGSRAFDRRPDAPPPAASGLDRPPPLPDTFLTIDPRLMLFGADRALLVGRPEMAREAVLKPIERNGAVVGHLGYVPRLKAVASLERLFSAEQNRRFATIGAGLLLGGTGISALLSWWLARRIRRLASGAQALIQGHYDVRVAVEGHDELARLASDFNQLAHTLEAARRARQQWIADIAHELRTPLSVLRGEIEALQDGVRAVNADTLGSLAQEVGHLSRLVDDLRTLSLSDTGALTYHKGPVDLAEVVDDVLQSQRGALEARGFDVHVDRRATGLVSVNETRLAQVFGNLLQNTLRYTDSPARLAVCVTAEAGQAEVVWEDSSPGVPDADLPRLTERLFRVEASRSRAGGGSGLGLAIASAIVAAHGGTMAASTSAWGGLRWSLKFPLLEGEGGHG